MATSNTKRKINLWRENPSCSHCGTFTKMYHRLELKGIEPPDDMATVDHVPGTTVLACWKCNRERGVLSKVTPVGQPVNFFTAKAPESPTGFVMAGSVVWQCPLCKLVHLSEFVKSCDCAVVKK